MALKLIQQVKVCPYCMKNTICSKNSNEISWMMHLFLAIFTVGLYLVYFFIMAFFHAAKKSISHEPWICSQCGNDVDTVPTKLTQGFHDPKPLIGKINIPENSILNKNVTSKYYWPIMGGVFIGLPVIVTNPTIIPGLILVMGIGGVLAYYSNKNKVSK
jgi:hypothetical protein